MGESQGCLEPDLLWKQGKRREEKQGLTFQNLNLTSTLPPQPTLTPLSSFLFCPDTDATQNSSLPTCVPRTGVFPTPLLRFSGTWLLLSQKRHSWLKSLMVPEGPDGICVGRTERNGWSQGETQSSSLSRWREHGCGVQLLTHLRPPGSGSWRQRSGTTSRAAMSW